MLVLKAPTAVIVLVWMPDIDAGENEMDPLPVEPQLNLVPEFASVQVSATEPEKPPRGLVKLNKPVSVNVLPFEESTLPELADSLSVKSWTFCPPLNVPVLVLKLVSAL